MKTKRLLVFCLFLAFGIFTDLVIAQDYSLYNKASLVVGKDTLPYRIMFPENLEPDRKYPLILFLHGSGERGNDNEAQLTHGADLFMRGDVRANYPAFVVFPQCRKGVKWNNSVWKPGPAARQYTLPEGIEKNLHQDLLKALMERLESSLPLDKDRLYVGGLSMGVWAPSRSFNAIRENLRQPLPYVGEHILHRLAD
ncbi:alpha/beta hydrolase-fold protein [Aureitalea marina]|uniref:carboxylesterase family protein n=1 Tax=Aureitalea marina TaxID=930804 RepID=UPI000CF1CD20|nr:alpha/beta hydrolase-fold protein [Aureitalea marina]